MRETYFHRLPKVPKGATCVNVARRGPRWLKKEQKRRLERRSELAPAPELLDAFIRKRGELQERGLSTVEAHNQAFVAMDYRKRFLDQILQSPQAMRALSELVQRDQQEEEEVYLVCHCGPGKHCHRFLLLELATSELGASVESS